MTSALVLRQLQPWFENLGKRQVKSPKVYIVDSGLLHALLNLETDDDLAGASQDRGFLGGLRLERGGYANRRSPGECYFWATHGGAELDLLVIRGRKRWGFELKHSALPRMTRSMHSALADLSLDRLDVVHTGEHTFPLKDKTRALALTRLKEDLSELS